MSNQEQVAASPPDEEAQPSHDLYALAICASKIDGFLQRMESRPHICLARSNEEAIGKGVTKARAVWPPEQGWLHHGSAPLLVPPDVIGELAKIQAGRRGKP